MGKHNQPVVARAASPLEAAGIVLVDEARYAKDARPAVIKDAERSAPEGKASQWARETARLHRVPLFSCDVDVTAGNGTVIALHGYRWAAVAGEPCKVDGCTGKVRAE